MDVRTVIILTVEGTLSSEEGLALIASECGISTESLVNALTPKRGKTSLATRRWTNEDDATIIKMWKAGKSAGDIAKVTNRTRNSVSQRIHFLRNSGHDLEKRETAGMARIRLNRQQLKLPGL